MSASTAEVSTVGGDTSTDVDDNAFVDEENRYLHPPDEPLFNGKCKFQNHGGKKQHVTESKNKDTIPSRDKIPVENIALTNAGKWMHYLSRRDSHN